MRSIIDVLDLTVEELEELLAIANDISPYITINNLANC